MPRSKFSDRFQPMIPWIENNVYLGPNSAIPGRIHLEPWQRGIIAAYEDTKVHKLSLMMSSQVGKSVLMLCIMSYHMGVSPLNMMLVQPGIKTLERFVKEKIRPMLDASPLLSEKVQRTQMQTIRPESIPYDGGEIFMAYSGSPSSLRSLSAPKVFCDEVDVYKGNEDTENPLSIVWQRTIRYGSRAKMVNASTPISSGTSLIEMDFNEGSQSYWFVPCPHNCTTEEKDEFYHYISWDNIHNFTLYCPNCGSEITEPQRLDIIDSGYWHEENPNEEHKSFHYNQLSSPHTPLIETCKQYSPANPRGFWTQVLGLPYRSLVDDAISTDAVSDLKTDTWDLGDGEKTIKDAEKITCSVDVQGNRLEVQTMYWIERVPRIHHHFRIPMSEANPKPSWDTLNKYLFDVQPDIILVDRHFPDPDTVDVWASESCSYWINTGKMFLIVGTDNSFNSPLIKKRPTPKEPYYLSLSVDTGKQWVHSMARNKGMSINKKEGMVPDDFCEQLASEELRWAVTQSGREYKKWVPIRQRNEALDCAVYNVCGAEYLGIDYNRQEAMSMDEVLNLL